jgi:hypothetical protein
MADVEVLLVVDEGDPHGDSVLAGLTELDVPSTRFNLTDLRSAVFSVQPDDATVRLGSDPTGLSSGVTVWWRRAGRMDISGLDDEEARLAWDEGPHVLRGALSLANPRWVDEPFDVERAEHKLIQLRSASLLGLAVPRTMVTNDPAAARQFADGRRVIAKALSSGEGIAPFVGEVDASELDLVATMPVLLQELIDAPADLRVVVVGGVAWTWRRSREPGTVDWRATDPRGDDFRVVDNPVAVRQSIRLTSALGLSMSVVDWLQTSTDIVLLEVNPQGAWLFLEGSMDLVTPAVARHLSAALPSGDGHWPRSIRRFWWDLKPASRAPANDGVVAPTFATPSWVGEAAARPGALDVARRSHDEAKAGAKVAEEKAARLVQASLALLTLTVALGAFQVQFALQRSWPWIGSTAPVGVALLCLALATFEAIEIDRVGMYSHPSTADLSGLGPRDPVEVLVAEEEHGRFLAAWTSVHKHTDLMQARAWLSRGLAALLVAGMLAAVLRGAAAEGVKDRPLRARTTTVVSRPQP